MNTLFSGALFIGILTAVWSKVKAILARAYSIVVAEAVIDGNLACAVKAYCWENLRRSPFGIRNFTTYYFFVRSIKKTRYVCFETAGLDPIIFFKGWKPILVSGVAAEGTAPGSSSPRIDGAKINISFIRGTFKLEDLVKLASDKYNSQMDANEDEQNGRRRRFFIERLVGMGARRNIMNGESNTSSSKPLGGTPQFTGDAARLSAMGQVPIGFQIDDLGPELSGDAKALSALSLPQTISDLVTTLYHWLKSKEWYASKRIPWTYGWLIYGKPGTGKTSLIRAIAEDFDLPVFSFDLSSMSNAEFCTHWRNVQQYSPCIVLMEDFDAVFDKRINKLGEEGGGLTFDCLLNCLGGIEQANGIFKVITTNNIQTLDEAIGIPRAEGSHESTRPGRMDVVFEMPALDEACRRALASRILCDMPEMIDKVVKDSEGDTGAQLQDRCTKIALEHHWKSKPNRIDPNASVLNISLDTTKSTSLLESYESSRMEGKPADETLQSVPHRIPFMRTYFGANSGVQIKPAKHSPLLVEKIVKELSDRKNG